MVGSVHNANGRAQLVLLHARTQDPGVTFSTYATRTIARIAEIATQQANVLQISIQSPDSTNATISDIVDAFKAAGASTTTLPASPSLGPFALDYNLAQWGGNTTAYLTCNLDVRGPEYLGACVDLPVTCTNNPGSDTRPYNCTKVADNSTVPGTIRNITYRLVMALYPCRPVV